MLQARLQNEILPKAFAKEGAEFFSCEFDTGTKGEDQFASNVVFVKVTVKKKNEKIVVPVVVKVEPFNQAMRELVITNVQFYNEVYMYSQVLPILQKAKSEVDIFPHFHYGVGTLNDSDKNVIILQDLRPLGFCLSKNKSFLDFDHLALAMSKLGQFHALSYASKESSQELFKVASGLKDSFCSKGHKIHNMIKVCLHRAIDPLLKNQKHVEVLQKFLTRVDGDFLQLLLDLVSPKDPLAVICHGDFCRNNILFKYSEGKPTDARFFDIATSRCASPAIDIIFFLFLNSSNDLRKIHWDALLETYHRALSSTVPTAKSPSLEEIKEAVRQKGIWGLVHCSFFLPVMLFEGPTDFENMTPEKLIEMNSTRGGNDGTKVLNELVSEMVERGMFDL